MRKFPRWVAVASSRQLLGCVGLEGRRFWVSRAPRLAAPPGRGGAAGRHEVSLQPRAGYYFSSVYSRNRRGSEVSIPPKVTQQVAFAGRGLRDSQRLSRPAPPLARGRSRRLPAVRATPLRAFRPRSAAARACGAPRRVRTGRSTRVRAVSVPHQVHLPETPEPRAHGGRGATERGVPLYRRRFRGLGPAPAPDRARCQRRARPSPRVSGLAAREAEGSEGGAPPVR